MADAPVDSHDETERRRALASLEREIVACRRCPRLVAWREQVAETKRAAFRDQTYWARPLPGFGDVDGSVYLLGLAPAAHGGNRTGRVFTGDPSGDWLYAALWRAGFASQPVSEGIGDGLTLHGAYVAAAVRCAPPANKPTTVERDACAPFLHHELSLLANVRVIVALGRFAHDVTARELGMRPRPRFGHGAEAVAPGGIVLLDSYHPSQRNTSTRTLTASMLDDVLLRARTLVSATASTTFDQDGGDPACWAHLTCPVCGGVVDEHHLAHDAE
jgi:uracil-DNA glycosylase family 4